MTAYQPPRPVPVFAVVDGFSATWILAHLDMTALENARRTWQLQGSHGVVLVDQTLGQLRAAKADYVRRSNAGMIPEPVERPQDEETITDPITSQEAATLLECSDRYIRALATQDAILGKLQGRTWVLSRASVLAYRDARDQVPEAA